MNAAHWHPFGVQDEWQRVTRGIVAGRLNPGLISTTPPASVASTYLNLEPRSVKKTVSHHFRFFPVNSSASAPASYTLRRASRIDCEHTETARAWVSVKAKSSTSDWMLPSKIMPTNSPLRFTTGLPEFPPMMSAVLTKLKGVLRL